MEADKGRGGWNIQEQIASVEVSKGAHQQDGNDRWRPDDPHHTHHGTAWHVNVHYGFPAGQTVHSDGMHVVLVAGCRH